MQYGPTEDGARKYSRNCQQIWYGVYVFAQSRRCRRAFDVVGLPVGPSDTRGREGSGACGEDIAVSGFELEWISIY